MSLWSELKAKIGGKATEQEIKDFSFQVIEQMFVNSAHFSEINFENVVREAYEGNELVKAAIDEIIEGVLVCKLKAKDEKGNEVDESPMQELFKGTTLSQDDLFRYILLHYFLDGNGYWKLDMGAKVGKSRKVKDLVPLMPHQVKIKGGKRALIDYYEFKVGAERAKTFKPEVMFHFKHLSPTSFIHGVTPLKAGFKQIDTDNEVSNSVKALEENQGRPGLMLSSKGNLTQKQKKQIKQELKEKFTGSKRGEPAIFSGDVQLLREAFSPKELEQLNVRRICETRILALLGVPGQLLGTFSGMERSIFANMEAARVNFHDYTIVPLKSALAKAITRNKALNPNGFEYFFDDDETEVGKIKKRKEAEIAEKQWNSGIRTLNETRTACGLPEVEEGGDEFKQSGNPLGGLFDGVQEAERSVQPKKNEGSNQKACGCCHKKKKKANKGKKEGHETKGGRNNLRNLSHSLGRVNLAFDHFKRLREWAEFEFKQEKDEAVALLEAFADNLVEASANIEIKQVDVDAFDETLDTVALGWSSRSARTVEPIMTGLVVGAAEQATRIELGLDFTIPPDEALAFIKDYSFKFGKKISESSVEIIRREIHKAVDEGLPFHQVRSNLIEKLDGVSASRAGMIAQTETIRAANAGAVNAYKSAGIEQIEWVASSDPCEFCGALDGTVIEIDDGFANLGDTLTGSEGGVLQLKYESLNYPPAHPNCECVAVAVVKDLS